MSCVRSGGSSKAIFFLLWKATQLINLFLLVRIKYLYFSRTHASHIYQLRNSDVGCNAKDRIIINATTATDFSPKENNYRYRGRIERDGKSLTIDIKYFSRRADRSVLQGTLNHRTPCYACVSA